MESLLGFGVQHWRFDVLILTPTVVDHVMEIMNQYQANMEHDALLNLDLSITRSCTSCPFAYIHMPIPRHVQVHILSGDLVLRRRTLEPVKKMIHGIMHYDVQRCIALVQAEQPSNTSRPRSEATRTAESACSRVLQLHSEDLYGRRQ